MCNKVLYIFLKEKLEAWRKTGRASLGDRKDLRVIESSHVLEKLSCWHVVSKACIVSLHRKSGLVTLSNEL